MQTLASTADGVIFGNVDRQVFTASGTWTRPCGRDPRLRPGAGRRVGDPGESLDRRRTGSLRAREQRRRVRGRLVHPGRRPAPASPSPSAPAERPARRAPTREATAAVPVRRAHHLHSAAPVQRGRHRLHRHFDRLDPTAAQAGRGGDFRVAGGDGSNGQVIGGVPLKYNSGGYAFLGGARRASGVAATTTTGFNGYPYGGGASGPANGATQSAVAGSTGAAGIVIVTTLHRLGAGMPLNPPETSTSDIAWIVNGRYSPNSVTSFQVKVTVEGPSDEAEGDACLQALVDLLGSRFAGVAGTKAFTAPYTTRAMTPS
jgi:hypothetical protein